MPDYYEILGVPKTATKDDIKKAYRKAALRTHPDRAPADQKKKAEEAFRVVNAAYEILHDDANRSAYDKHGSWPPPPPPPPKNSFPTRPPQAPEYKPFNPAAHAQQPFFEGGAHPHFVFTDPFALFNMIFADLFQPHVQVPFPGGRPHARTPVPPGMFDPAAAAFVHPPPFMHPQHSFAQAANQFVPNMPGASTRPGAATAPPPPAAHAEAVSTDDDSNGWVKESKVTKMTPQGTRETTVKKTAPDGTIYITRISGDGIERHYVSVNGVEKPTSSPPPRTPPRVPLTQTQAQTPPSSRQHTYPTSAPQPQRTPSRAQGHSSASRHAPSASQPVNMAQPFPAAQFGQPAVHPEGQTHRRSSSRAPIFTTNYRAASPPPMQKGEGVPAAAYAYSYAQAPGPSQRATSPLPGAEKRSSHADPRPAQADPLRRNHTVPTHMFQAQTQTAQAQQAQAQAPMPRPQSPHFYRTRSTSEHKRQQAAIPLQQPAAAPASHRARAIREEEGIYIFSDSEGMRGRSSAHRPSRSSKTMPVPAPASATYNPNKSSRESSTKPPSQRSAYPHLQTPGHAAHQPIVVDTPSSNNGLGLGFVPPPSAGLGPAHREAMKNVAGTAAAPNPPLGRSSRNASVEDIVVYPYGQSRKSGAHPQATGGPYGNPLPNPPMMREPWVGEPQQVRYRQAA